ncbi:uncharacterized protein [Lolium perenne]|uniref:uncharacterized protein n=1 Tax=Lolium perenne TaxID=4522 RepID=UPI0021F627F6|nr:uncharacterized protein LOC127329701 [Lolium perenne]
MVFHILLHASGFHLSLGTYESVHETVPAYDAVAWHLAHRWCDLNFHDVKSLVEAEIVAGPPRLITDEDRLHHRKAQRRLAIAMADERAMETWHANFPQDVVDEKEFFA